MRKPQSEHEAQKQHEIEKIPCIILNEKQLIHYFLCVYAFRWKVGMSHKKQGAAPLLGTWVSKTRTTSWPSMQQVALSTKESELLVQWGSPDTMIAVCCLEYNGHITLNRCWSKSLMCYVGPVRWKGTKAVRKLPDNFADLKAGSLQRITEDVSQRSILPPAVAELWPDPCTHYPCFQVDNGQTGVAASQNDTPRGQDAGDNSLVWDPQRHSSLTRSHLPR